MTVYDRVLTEYYLFFLVRYEHMESEASSICSKLDKSSDILKCLPDELRYAGQNSRGYYRTSEPFYTPDPQGFAQEFSRKLIALAETDKQVKKMLKFEVKDIELQERYGMKAWNISFPKLGLEDF